jgi:hypothetical protein
MRLPIIDITHPAFATELGPATLPEAIARYVEEERRRQRVPQWLTGLFLRLAGGNSYLIRAMANARASGYLPALTTYLLKLGAPNLVPPLDNDIDRRIVETLPARSLRLRLGQVATLLARGLAPLLEADAGRPLRFLNIAGGPAMDSLNALILLRRDHPASLADRPIVIDVLDIDGAGPAFGRAALAALSGADGPLAGVDAELRHVPWNWSDRETLERMAADLAARRAIVAVSSEGGLFEYGEDGEITGVLGTLAKSAPADTIVAGSVTRADPATLLFRRRSLFPIIPRGAERFSALAKAAGWRVDEIESAAFSDQVLLRRA